MLAFDLPPPAIVQVRPALDMRLCLNGEEGGAFVPRDFLAMPAALRATVALDELRQWLPAEYRLVPDGLLANVLYANLPGLPGVLMAGNIKKAWLYTTNGQFPVPGSWNKRDNAIHALGRGGNGRQGITSGLGVDHGGGGGGGAAWSGLFNREFILHDLLDVVVATSSGNTSFVAPAVCLAASGGNAPSVSGGDGPGGSAGSASNSVGDQTTSGGRGEAKSGASGGDGGGAGGPHGDGLSGDDFGLGDAGFGGGSSPPSFDGVDSISGGFNPGGKVNAGSGRGGVGSLSFESTPGRDGGEYGAGGGGGSPMGNSSAGAGATGCVLIINNASK